jgi:tetratricopeptide (TPR) repeat protein
MAIEFQYQVFAGQPDGARRLLADFVAAATANEQDGRRLQVAHFLHDFLQVYPLSDQQQLAAALRNSALQYFGECRTIDADALQRHVVLLAQNGRTGDAFEALQKSRSAHPPETLAAAQVMILRQGHATEQQKKATAFYLLEELEKKPASTALRVSLADCYQQCNERDKAIAAYRDVLSREPNNIVALNNLAWTLATDRDQSREALDLVQRAIDLAGPIDDLLDTRARIRFESGDAQAGLRDLIEAVSEVPTATRLADLADMHRKAGQADLADRALERMRRHRGQDPAARGQRSEVRGPKTNEE